eukprot:TRINITY_DN6944_c0_g2_i1.p1 TRINITY_DN6944_c0_g2~~TRINITY_DN6944_c0_g2_i1.p1  ORF type:complete len:142 (+),score=10.28 TRINITY_DN6944_c0_g2_i1:32-457(+)
MITAMCCQKVTGYNAETLALFRNENSVLGFDPTDRTDVQCSCYVVVVIVSQPLFFTPSLRLCNGPREQNLQSPGFPASKEKSISTVSKEPSKNLSDHRATMFFLFNFSFLHMCSPLQSIYRTIGGILGSPSLQSSLLLPLS